MAIKVKKMIKRGFCALLVLLLILAMGACDKPEKEKPSDDPPTQNEQEEDVKTVAVSMPMKGHTRWQRDGENIEEGLQRLGYKVVIEYAEEDELAQVTQIEKMLKDGCDCLVVAAVDPEALAKTLAKVQAANIPVISYDRLVMDTEAVNYYVTFDNKSVGTQLADYVKTRLDLAGSGDPLSFELFMGAPNDNNARLIYTALMAEIQPYIDSGRLVCRSGQLSFEDTATERWDEARAEKRCQELLDTYYPAAVPDIIFSAYDGLSYGCITALENSGWRSDSGPWPLITGQDAEVAAVQNIIGGKQAMTIVKDTRLLASRCVVMVTDLLNNESPEVNDSEHYENGKIVVPTYVCDVTAVDRDNYTTALIDTGYYTAEELAAVGETADETPE